MKIKSSRLIEYFGSDETANIRESYMRIIDLNSIEAEDFDELIEVLDAVSTRRGLLLIPSYDDHTKLREFQRHFASREFKDKPLLKSILLYAEDDSLLEGCSDEELESFSSIVTTSGKTDRIISNFIDIDGLRNLTVAEHISDQGLLFLAKSSNILTLMDQTLDEKVQELMAGNDELAKNCIFLQESKQLFNMEKTSHLETHSYQGKIALDYVTPEDITRFIDAGVIDKVRIKGLVIDGDYKLPESFFDIIDSTALSEVFIKDEHGASSIYRVDELQYKADEVIPDEDYNNVFIDLSLYNEAELVFIAHALVENFKEQTVYPADIHIICDENSIEKLNILLQNISPSALDRRGYNMYDAIVIDTIYGFNERDAAHHSSFDNIKRVNIGTGFNASNKSRLFPNASVEPKGVQLIEGIDFDEIDGLTLSKMLQFVSIITLSSEATREKLEQIAKKKGLDYYITESNVFINFSRCKDIKNLPAAALTENDYEYLKNSGKLQFLCSIYREGEDVDFINERQERLFKIGRKYDERSLGGIQTICFCDGLGTVIEIPVDKYKAIRDKIERYFEGKESPLLNQSPVIDLSYFTEEELKYLAIFLRQEAYFEKDSKYAQKEFTIIEDELNPDKTGIFVQGLRSFDEQSLQLLNQATVVTSDPRRIDDVCTRITGGPFYGNFVTDFFENLTTDELRALGPSTSYVFSSTAFRQGTSEVGPMTKQGMYMLLRYGNLIKSLKGIDMTMVKEVLAEHPELEERIIILENGQIVNAENYNELFMGGGGSNVALDNISLLDYAHLRDLNLVQRTPVGARVSIKTEHPEELQEDFLKRIEEEKIFIVVTKENLEAVLNSPLYKKYPDRIIFQIRNLNEVSLEDVSRLQTLGISRVQVYDTSTERHQTKPYDVDKFYHIKKHMDELTSEIPEGLSELEIAAILYFRVSTSYVYDDDACEKTTTDRNYCNRSSDTSRNLENACIYGKTVCAGYAEVLRCAFLSMGIEAEYVRCECPNDTAHAYVRAKIDGVWYNFDPTWDNSVLSMIRKQDGIHVSGFPEYFMQADDELSGDKIDRRGRECTQRFPRREVRRVFRDLYDGRLGPVMKVETKNEDQLLVAKKKKEAGGIHAESIIFDGIDPDGIYDDRKIPLDIDEIEERDSGEKEIEESTSPDEVPEVDGSTSDSIYSSNDKLPSSKIPRKVLEDIQMEDDASDTINKRIDDEESAGLIGRIKKIVKGWMLRKNQLAIPEETSNEEYDKESKLEDDNPWKVDKKDINDNSKDDDIKDRNGNDNNNKPKGDDPRVD